MGKLIAGKFLPAAVAVFAVSVTAAAEIVDWVAASVDGRAITESEVRRAILTSGFEPAPGESASRFRDRVLSEMIDDYLRYRHALRFSPAPPDAAAVDGALQKVKQRLKTEGKDPDAEFRRAGMSLEEVRASLEKQLVVSQYVRERYSALAFLSPEELQREYEGPFSDAYRQSGRPVPSFADAENEVREGLRARRTADEIDKWTKDLREKARITIYTEVPPVEDRRQYPVPPTP